MSSGRPFAFPEPSRPKAPSRTRRNQGPRSRDLVAHVAWLALKTLKYGPVQTSEAEELFETPLDDGGDAIDWGDGTGRAAVESITYDGPVVSSDPEDILTAVLNTERATRIALYRESPSFAKGHLETLALAAGDAIDLDSIHREWGGGRIRFRPMSDRGRFVGKSASFDFAGPPLYKGQPIDHRGNPIVTKPVVETTAIESRVYGRDTRGGVVPTSDNEAVRQLGGAFQMLIERMDRMEQRLQAPAPNPSDPNAMLTNFMAMAKQFKALKGMFDDDAFGAPEEPEPPSAPSIQEMLPMLLMYKFMGNDGGGAPGQGQGAPDPFMAAAMQGMMAQHMGMPTQPPGMPPNQPPPFAQPSPPQGQRQATPPQPQQQPETIAPSQAGPPAPPNPAQVAQLLQRVPPEQRQAYALQIMQALGLQAPGGAPGPAGAQPPAPDDPYANGGEW